MDAYEALKETFDDLFQQAVEEGCYTEDEAAELVESLDIYSLLQVVRHNATTVYSYITQGRQERSFNYRGEDLFRQKATLLYEETDQVTMEIVVATRTLELWLLEDMSLAVVSCVSVNYDHDGYITQYRTIKDTPVMDSELCLDLGELVEDLNGLCGPVYEHTSGRRWRTSRNSSAKSCPPNRRCEAVMMWMKRRSPLPRSRPCAPGTPASRSAWTWMWMCPA